MSKQSIASLILTCAFGLIGFILYLYFPSTNTLQQFFAWTGLGFGIATFFFLLYDWIEGYENQ